MSQFVVFIIIIALHRRIVTWICWIDASILTRVTISIIIFRAITIIIIMIMIIIICRMRMYFLGHQIATFNADREQCYSYEHMMLIIDFMKIYALLAAVGWMLPLLSYILYIYTQIRKPFLLNAHSSIIGHAMIYNIYVYMHMHKIN